MGPKVGVTRTSNLKGLQQQLDKVANSEVLVGIPESANQRNEAGIGNAELMFILTNGSPLNHIPATPIIEAAINRPATKRNIGAELGEASKAFLNNDPVGARRHLDLAGQIGENASKAIFTDNDWPANAASTIRRKGSDRRNIDLGELRRSITHLIVEKS